MRSRVRQGFTLIELLVVIAIIAILASILFPVFAKAREKARQTTCTSQVRQLATAIQMYTQDNSSRYPGIVWNLAIDTYVGSQKLFFCPSDAANDKGSPISYGYAGILVRSDDKTGVANTGVNEAQITAPTEVGCIADATPSRLWADNGGLIGGGGLVDPIAAASNNAVELDPRHNGVIVGFCDGHAKFFPGKQANLKDISYGPGRAFYQAIGLGFVKNFGGGIQKVTPNNPATTTGFLATATNTVSIGGDFATMPIVMAAAEVWAGNGFKWYSRGFKGAGDVNNITAATAKNPDWRRALASTHYCWGVADGGKINTGALVSTNIAKDALVFIVSKNTKLMNNTAPYTITQPNINNVPEYSISSAQLQALFGFTGTYRGYSANGTTCNFQAYTMDNQSGSAVYAQTMINAAVAPYAFGSQGIKVTDDLDMVEKVAADPYGIGYCSSAFADTDKVTILALGTILYPNQNQKYRWLVPTGSSIVAGEFEYPLVRQLRVVSAGNGGYTATAGVNGTFSNIFGDTEFQNGPLFRATSYWL